MKITSITANQRGGMPNATLVPDSRPSVPSGMGKAPKVAERVSKVEMKKTTAHDDQAKNGKDYSAGTRFNTECC